jgi:hypothetical protein
VRLFPGAFGLAPALFAGFCAVVGVLRTACRSRRSWCRGSVVGGPRVGRFRASEQRIGADRAKIGA